MIRFAQTAENQPRKKKPQKLSLNFCATWKKLMQFLIKSAQGLNKTIKQQK